MAWAANNIRTKFLTYKNGLNGIVIKLADGPKTPPPKVSVAKETTDLADRRERLSVDILSVQLSKREAELLQQKAEVTELAKSLKLASEDAKRIVEEERTSAHTEIESSRSVVQRVQQALQEHVLGSKYVDII
ncbi:hypothetical protein GUJ93_ZPchr0006g42662 [Zizania palustris]|uniref:Stomatal closure-related actin-binding protein coiled-coil domain-containing protein n=1 Tax=Zizania palustris TaxID=103762 RepID=A0A8J5T5V0_ZIZPA|nr:hypothetical protein GUJ93_ZPchr0006g42662 [Zizania palustris]